MAFILSQSTSYPWPVVYEAPKADGKFERHSFSAEFKRLPQSSLEAMYKEVQQDGVNDAEFLDQILVGWSEIKDEHGNEVPFNAATRRVVLDLPGMAGAIVKAYFDSIRGAPRKN